MKAMRGRIIAEVLDKPNQTEGGLYLPESRVEKPMRVRAISVGGDYIQRSGKVVKPPCKEGDIIHLSNKWRKPMRYEGKDILPITFEEVIGSEA